MIRPRRAGASCDGRRGTHGRTSAGLLLGALVALGCGDPSGEHEPSGSASRPTASAAAAPQAAPEIDASAHAIADAVTDAWRGTQLADASTTSALTRSTALPGRAAPPSVAAASRTTAEPPSPPGQTALRDDIPLPPRAGRLAIVIDDVGWNRDAGLRAIALPGPLTLAVLPGTPVGAELSRAGFAAGHEIILHQPMAPMGAEAPGPGALLADSSDDDVARIIAANLAAVPHRVGLSNHMGSLLTSRPDAMQQLMRSVAAQGIYFLDSRTTAATVALDAARHAAVPAIRRDLFLDNEPDPDAIEAALDAALALAVQRGNAIAIGHPRPATLEVLERRLPALRKQVRLVPVSALVAAAAAAGHEEPMETAAAAASGGTTAGD